MKNSVIKYIIGAFILSTSLISCSLDTDPTDAIESEKVFSTVEGNEKVLNGAWSYLMESFSTYANPGFGSFLRTNDAMGSDVVLNGRYGFRAHYLFNALYSKARTNTHSWNLAYKTIDNANNVIAKVFESEGSVVDKQRVRGQALALRGFMYLHLASSYAYAIDLDPNAITAPIYLEPTSSATKPRPAATVTEVYLQSIKDLEEALTLIPETYKRGNTMKHKFDREVVLGLLSRAHLYARNWKEAKEYSDQLLALNSYLMNESEYKSGFSDSSNGEWIWGHAQNESQKNASYQFNYLDVTSSQSYYYSFNADPYFRDLFDESDYRKSMIYWAPDPSNTEPKDGNTAYMRYAKFKFRGSQIADIVLMRTSEIYLINAEAKARLGEADAIDVLNTLKTARGAKEVSGLMGQDLLDEIWIERRKELFGEGFALIDIIRNQQKVVRKAYPQDKLVDFTYEEMDSTGKISQVVVKLLPMGHDAVKFPDGSDFIENSKYYLYRIPEVEERENPNLYLNR
ncbi:MULTISPECIES: RagB/SusD family nutrient uptake outer membrane protein [Myroides]|uniref:RagB/SusD family nutrient uptake outer membrane protein n=1 Tax=Myroides albus TaxID=2562892 RepID=A0A6I3LHR6_9FLAO|nr:MULTISPECIES: RagB/SusD family nutrient uptake outer membrane protein [Myroides]MTG98058.1 RagB/SusD family nutrient uptake outer membrane protein [Myroides albus]MVX36304.1 RagB/SusD family nutrient uptake outer membrane protein [Myroides sp. LoEW2-1]UVD80762.1 RagB/SusD family nutrient uptake outer membrane protein [Myroides albus]